MKARWRTGDIHIEQLLITTSIICLHCSIFVEGLETMFPVPRQQLNSVEAAVDLRLTYHRTRSIVRGLDRITRRSDQKWPSEPPFSTYLKVRFDLFEGASCPELLYEFDLPTVHANAERMCISTSLQPSSLTARPTRWGRRRRRLIGSSSRPSSRRFTSCIPGLCGP